MKKVLIIRGSAIGDVVRYLPVASAIKSHFGEDCEVHWLVRKKLNEILESNRFVDKILYFEDYKDLQFRGVKRIYRRRTNLNGLSSWLRFSSVKNLQRENYDAVINLHNILDAKIFSEMSGAFKHIAAPGIDGVSNKKCNAVLQFLATVKLLDNSFSEESFTKGTIDYGWNFTEDELSKTNLILKENGCENGYIVFVLGTTWESKNYPVENWIKLAELLSEVGKKIVCIGDDKDKCVFAQIKSNQIKSNQIKSNQIKSIA